MALKDHNGPFPVLGKVSLKELFVKYSTETPLEERGYTTMDLIAEGGYGRVYKGYDRVNDRAVALKYMDHSEKEGLHQATIREIGLLRCAGNHENIVTVLDCCLVPKAMVLVMPLFQHDLSTFIKDQKKAKIPVLNDALIRRIMRGILVGTHHLHCSGIAHRDLKPRNILLTNDHVPKIADFGLSRFLAVPARTESENFGTRWYRPPEVLLSCKPTTHRVDLWSIGTIWAEMKEKQALFPGRDHDDQVHLIFSTLGTPTERVWPEISRNSVMRKLNLPFYDSDRLAIRCPSFSEAEMRMLRRFLHYRPVERINACDAIAYFS